MKKITLILSILLFFVACKSTKNPVKTEISEIYIKKDSAIVVEKNKQIIDSLIVTIGKIKTNKPQCDSVTQQAIDNLLKQLNTSKHSGDNSFKLYYDDLKKQLIAIATIGQTKNTAINNSSTSNQKKTTLAPVITNIVPPYIKYLAGLGVLCLVLIIAIATIKFSKIFA